MMKKITILMLTIFVLIISIASAVYATDLYYKNMDLENYPLFFVNNERLDFNFVLGEFAQSSDAIVTAQIANSLIDNLDEIMRKTDLKSENFELEISGSDNLEDQLRELYIDVLNKKKDKAAKTILDTALDSKSILNKNLIIVGGPCVNSAAAYFYGYPEDCAEGFAPGRAKIELFRNGRGIAMIVAGFSAEDTQTAGNILSHYEDYSSNFAGELLRVSSAWLTELKIR